MLADIFVHMIVLQLNLNDDSSGTYVLQGTDLKTADTGARNMLLLVDTFMVTLYVEDSSVTVSSSSFQLFVSSCVRSFSFQPEAY